MCVRVIIYYNIVFVYGFLMTLSSTPAFSNSPTFTLSFRLSLLDLPSAQSIISIVGCIFQYSLWRRCDPHLRRPFSVSSR